jgi:hypothetical protein
MIRVAAKLGVFPLPGVRELPKEGFTAKLERAQGDVDDYARRTTHNLADRDEWNSRRGVPSITR